VFHVRLRVVPRAALGLACAAGLILPASALGQAPRLGSRVLREGMSGPDVKALQQGLTRVGLRTPALGDFGPVTERQVRGFQRRYHLAVNGLVGPGFVRELKLVIAAGPDSIAAAGSGGSSLSGSAGGSSSKSRRSSSKTSSRSSAAPAAPTAPTAGAPAAKPGGGSQHLGQRTLTLGMHGHDVRVLQGYLTLAGFPTPVDGTFGPATQANVTAFEQAHGLTADGVVTYADQLALRQAVTGALAGGAVSKATINPDGTATAPAGAPALVQTVIASANQIIDKPYIYAGGHQSWHSAGYDCSGSVSYALHGAGLLSSPEDSTGLESYGSPGPGIWITIYADSGHTWIVVAGIAFDTADYSGPNIPAGTGPRWRSDPTANLADGGNYVVRHPAGL
jgi:peptidoglycan hydrolase-like protein with peptidoglycan-binding domain